MSAPPAIRTIPTAYAAGERAEYDALRSGCGIDRIVPRLLGEVEGTAALASLRAALRVRLHAPGPGDVAAGIVLVGGLVTAAVTVVRRADDHALIDCSNPTAAAALDAAGVEYATHGDEVVRMRLRGPRLAAVLGGDPPAPGAVAVDAAFGGTPVILAGTGRDRATLYCDRDGARACWDALVAAGAVPVGSIALETVRIEDAEPCLERDFRNPVPPATAGLAAFAYGDDARVLVAIEHEGHRPAEGAVLRRGPVEVGDVRVAAASPARAGRPVALAEIDRALAVPGAPIDVDAGERVLAGVVTCRAALPVEATAPNY